MSTTPKASALALLAELNRIGVFSWLVLNEDREAVAPTMSNWYQVACHIAKAKGKTAEARALAHLRGLLADSRILHAGPEEPDGPIGDWFNRAKDAAGAVVQKSGVRLRAKARTDGYPTP